MGKVKDGTTGYFGSRERGEVIYTQEDYSFWKWHDENFSYGYGTGEQHWIPTLKKFFALIGQKEENHAGSYDFQILEKKLTPVIAWLLINTLCEHRREVGDSTLEYGTSPRFGWLTEVGEGIREYFNSHSEDELYDMTHADRDIMESLFDPQTTEQPNTKKV